MKVLFAASECAPMVKVGGLADVVGSLPKALRLLGVEVAIALPHYAKITPNYPEKLPGTEIPIYFLGTAEDYPGGFYPGGDQEYQRFATFSRQIVDFLETRQFEPDAINLHDYHSSLVVDIIRQRRLKVATVLTIHDVQNKGTSEAGLLNVIDLLRPFPRILDWDLSDRNIEMLLQGIIGSDVICTVSPTYAREILEPAVGGNLAQVLKAREARVYGILNGLDEQFFDPRTDQSLAQDYGPANWEGGKAANKRNLQEELHLAVSNRPPLLAMITRLVERKGIDLLLGVLPQLLSSGAQLVVLGQGDPLYEGKLKNLAEENPGVFAFSNNFDEDLAHRIYAAADFFLVPSRTEPCGLTQMIACRYGALPIVRQTGGLSDTVFEGANGYLFPDFSVVSFGRALEKALKFFKEKREVHRRMVEKAMGWDFSWESSAREYVQLYQKALEYSFGIARGAGGEIRKSALGNWTILSEGRSSRPIENAQLTMDKGKEDVRKKNYDSLSIVNSQLSIKSCPFEAGHEQMSPGEVFRIGPGELNSPGWRVRVVANKYPLLPAHEVVIYSPFHAQDLCDLPPAWVEDVIWTYLSRYRHYEDKGYVHIFCNHGREGAASLTHPHSQIIVLDELPKETVEALKAAEIYYESHGICPYCDTLRRELKDGPHFVFQNQSLVLLTPYASQWPYELTILPKTHRQSFGNMAEAERKDLAQILALAVRLYKEELKSPDYNFWLHSVPDLLGFGRSALFYHWHLEMMPRIKKLGGVELGLGIMVDDLISPEKAATLFRERLAAPNP